MLSLIPRGWLIMAAVAAMTAWSGFIAAKVHTRVTRNLTAYYEREIAQIQVRAEKAKQEAQENARREIERIQDEVNRISIPSDIDELRRLCQSDPSCTDGDGSRKN